MKKCSECFYMNYDGEHEPCVSCDETGNHWKAILQYNPKDVAFNKRALDVPTL